jgi:hypothetical protein
VLEHAANSLYESEACLTSESCGIRQNIYPRRAPSGHRANDTLVGRDVVGSPQTSVGPHCGKVPLPILQWVAERRRVTLLLRSKRPEAYSLHPPEVECIGKGKAKASCEFGCEGRSPPALSGGDASLSGACF